MSVRSAMDSTTFLVILFWVCLAAAAAVAEPVTRRDGVDNANALNAMRRERWKASIRSFFPWSRASKSNKSSAGDRDKGEKPAAEPKSPRGGGSYAKDNGYGGQDKPQTYATDGVAAYGTEGECLLANNDRPCVCFTADFLDPIGDQTASDESAASRCPSYKPAPKWFAVTRGTAIDGVVDDEDATNDDGTAAAARARRVVDFDRVVDYRLKTSKDDRFAVHYGLVGSDVKIRCSTDGNNTGPNATVFSWDYKKDKHTMSNSTISGTDANNLSIIGLDPTDSKNYTCSAAHTSATNKSKNGRPYTHYVIAVEKPIYEIYGTAFYKTTDNSGCTIEITYNVRKQLPSTVRSVMCPEGSLRYACNVDVVTSKCVKEEVGTFKIEYLVTLNKNASYLTRIRAHEKSRDALYYQQLLARVSNVMVENLNKILKVQIMSKMALINTIFQPDYGRIQIKTYVSCPPGFGIREVFCGACPPHHYSPDKTAECLKCPNGFHQPVSGSDECVKCLTPFSSGCYMREVPYITYFIAGLICLMVSFFVLIFCFCCYREKCETNVMITWRKIRKNVKEPKYSLLSKGKSYISSSQQKTRAVQKNFMIKEKSTRSLVNSSKITFKKLHDICGQDIKNGRIHKQSA